MHTPGHVLLNLSLLGSMTGFESAVIAGSVLPDIPIVILYLRERLRGTPTEIIWSECYQRRNWLAIIHLAHSIPVALLGICVGWMFSLRPLLDFFVSMLCHALCDFPVHVHDAHRHFFPLSNYRFISPWSYWDVRYHGRTVALLEAALVVGCAIHLFLHSQTRFASVPKPLLGLMLGGVVVWYAQNYYRNHLRA